MASLPLKDRVAALEDDVASLKEKIESTAYRNRKWLETIWGKFSKSRGFEEAMRLGREWRESFRPKPRRKKVAK